MTLFIVVIVGVNNLPTSAVAGGWKRIMPLPISAVSDEPVTIGIILVPRKVARMLFSGAVGVVSISGEISVAPAAVSSCALVKAATDGARSERREPLVGSDCASHYWPMSSASYASNVDR